jgi:hypothetical protein
MANLTAYGFHGLKDMFLTGAFDNNTLIPRVRTALIATAQMYTDQMNSLMDTMVQRVTYPKTRVQLGAGGTLQPLDEWGVPLPTRGGRYYETGFPIQGGGDAIGTNRISRVKMTVGDMNDRILDIQTKDADWLIRHSLASMFDNVSWTFADADPQIGNLTIKPLANNDSDVYAFNGLTTGVDNHYLAQAAAIADATNPYPGIRTKLDEHPDNGDPLVVYIPTNLVATTTALVEFTRAPDPTVTLLTGTVLNSNGANIKRMGSTVLGYLISSRMWVVEWKRLPNNYILALSLGARTPAIGMREFPEAALRGLFNEFNTPDGNLQEERFIRFAGFGALNRTAAVVQQIGAGSYSIPTGYDAPLSI